MKKQTGFCCKIWKTIRLIVPSSLLMTSICSAQVATTTVNFATPVMPNPKLLLGITYDCRSSLSIPVYGLAGYHKTDGTFIPEVDAVFNNFPMSTLRYPANGIMQGFEWKKSIGPLASRTPQQIFFQQSVPAQIMEFGFDEFMAMTAARGVNPGDVQIMAPIYSTSDPGLTAIQMDAAVPNVISSNADWVEYANAPNDGTNPGGGTDWAAVRTANGHEEPYGIQIWNMGNEPYTPNEYGSGGVNNYINKIIPIMDAMLAIDPTIKITVTVTGRATSMWTHLILNSIPLQSRVYAVNAHYFLSEEIINGSIPHGVNAISTMISELALAAQSKGYKMIVGDHAHALITASTPTAAEQDLIMQWQGANLTADFLLSMSQIRNIERSNFWVYGLSSNQWHPIRKNADGSYTSMPVAELYKTLSPLFLDNSIAVINTSPAASDGNPYSVRAGAFASGDLSQLNVIAVNRDKTNAVPLQVNGVSGYFLTNSRLLTAPALNSDAFSETPISPAANGNYLMPQMSILLLEYTSQPLPITLLSFDGHLQPDRTVLLNWTTASEFDNDYFTVERSMDGINWSALIIVPGAGNSHTVLHYSATDGNPVPGISYYRLRQTDFDVRWSFSDIIQINISKNNVFLAYPNPFSNEIVLLLDNEERNQPLIVYDAHGSIVFKSDNIPFTLKMNNLSSGIYYIYTPMKTLQIQKE